jgi:hypothetical protein
MQDTTAHTKPEKCIMQCNATAFIAEHKQLCSDCKVSYHINLLFDALIQHSEQSKQSSFTGKTSNGYTFTFHQNKKLEIVKTPQITHEKTSNPWTHPNKIIILNKKNQQPPVSNNKNIPQVTIKKPNFDCSAKELIESKRLLCKKYNVPYHMNKLLQALTVDCNQSKKSSLAGNLSNGYSFTFDITKGLNFTSPINN